jgi:dihydrofolate reductase
MKLALIAAADERNAIGKGNRLPWQLPDDLQRFRRLTEGKPVIMGRKTFASIGRPLSKRLNIVVTRNADLQVPGCDVATSLESALQIAVATGADTAFVIGGAEIYAQALPFADRIELTRVHTSVEGTDAFFPDIDSQEWREVARERHEADSKHTHAFTFLTYERR